MIGRRVTRLPLHRRYLYNMSGTKKDKKRRELGSSSRFPGSSVPAPGRSTPTGESSEGRVAGLPAGSAADTVTAEVVKDWSVFDRPDTEAEKAAAQRCRYLLSVAMGEIPASSISESDGRGDSLPDGQKEMPIIGEKRGSSRGAGRKVVSNVRPSRMRKTLVVDASDDSSESEPEGRSAADTVTAEVVKDYGVFGRPDTEQEKAAAQKCRYLLSVAMGEMPASSISESESRGDSLPDGQKEMPRIGEKRGSSRGAGRKVVSKERPSRERKTLDVDASDDSSDSSESEPEGRYYDENLTLELKNMVDIVMHSLPRRTPEKVVSRIFKIFDRVTRAEREKCYYLDRGVREVIQFGNEVARQAVQYLATNLERAQEQEASSLRRHERQVKALRDRMEIIQKERDSLREEVEALRKELLDCRAQKREERGESGKMLRASSVDGGGSHASEDFPPARDPSLGGVPGMIPEDTVAEDTSVRGGQVNGTEQIVSAAGEDVPRGESHPDCPPSSCLEKGELWVPVVEKRKQKMKNTRGSSTSDSGLPASPSDVVTNHASGAGTPREGLSFAMAARGTRDAAVSGKDPRVCPRSVAPAKRTARAGTQKRNSAVLVIRCSEGGPSYAEVMGEARSKIRLEELGIVDTRFRRAQTGGLLIEIQGENAGTKADSLAERLSSLFKEREEVRVIRPIRRMEFRLADLEESVTADEIKKAVAARGRVPLGDVRVGPLRPRGGGLNSVWLQCPEPCAEMIRKDGGLRVGWSRVRLIPLEKRRLQCYRCLAVGHTRVNCRSAVDRSNSCFKCGKEGHKAIGCRASPHCPVCAARSLPAGHRAGADGCTPYNGVVRATVAAAATVPELGSVPPLEDAMVVDG